ncbi:MAG: hypothetical protein IJT70_06240 [Clostridia bacterium]|nr:hypothetical protein [Clostridia bacterium]
MRFLYICGVKKIFALITAFLILCTAITSLAGCTDGSKKDETSAPATEDTAALPSNVIGVKRGDDGRPVLWKDEEEVPVKATYTYYGCFTHFCYETENKELIESLVNALRSVKISTQEGMMVSTADTILSFVMANGDEYRAVFTGENFEEDFGEIPAVYKTTGFGGLSEVLEKIAESEENLFETDITSALPDGNGGIELWSEDVEPVWVTCYYDSSPGVVGSAFTDDEDTIEELIDAVKQIRVGDKERKSNYKKFNSLSFKLSDGSYYEVNFYDFLFSTVNENSSLTYYETEGFDLLKPIIDKIIENDNEDR